MNEPIILHLITSLALVGGTAAKVRVLVSHSQYKHIVCYPKVKANNKYIAEWEKIENCTLIEGLTRKNYIKDTCLVNKLVKKYGVNIIHVYFPPDTITASLVKKLNPTMKLVRSFEGNVKQSFIKRSIIKIALNSFDKVIYISDYVKRFYEGGIPLSLIKKGTVIFNSAARQTNIEKPIKHSINTKKIITVSGLNPSKNLTVLIEAMRILKEKDKNIHLDILGDGPLREALQNKIDQYCLRSNITLHGFSDNVIEFLDASSIYVHPANNEGFGIAVVEAMQRYCAIIVSDEGALPEIITNNIDGLIAKANDCKDWANKIELLLNNQHLVDMLGEEAYKTVINKFSLDIYTKKHDTLYQSII
ncbi:glycosyltransferase family 4 protein [Phocaeicola sp.]